MCVTRGQAQKWNVKSETKQKTFDFFVSRQQHKNDNTHLAYLELQLSQNVEERNSYILINSYTLEI